jgi:hypothetical protein
MDTAQSTMSPLALGNPLYVGTLCACVEVILLPPRPTPRYVIVARADGRVLGELRWHPRRQRYVFVPGVQTAYTSQDVSEIGVWLRRLTALVLAARLDES